MTLQLRSVDLTEQEELAVKAKEVEDLKNIPGLPQIVLNNLDDPRIEEGVKKALAHKLPGMVRSGFNELARMLDNEWFQAFLKNQPKGIGKDSLEIEFPGIIRLQFYSQGSPEANEWWQFTLHAPIKREVRARNVERLEEYEGELRSNARKLLFHLYSHCREIRILSHFRNGFNGAPIPHTDHLRLVVAIDEERHLFAVCGLYTAGTILNPNEIHEILATKGLGWKEKRSIRKRS